MNEFKIEKGIKHSPPKTCKKYPFGDMKINDSFIINKEYSRENMMVAGNAARAWNKQKGFDRVFSTRKTKNNQIRIWRIK